MAVRRQTFGSNAIRLAGTVVYGPGSRMIARALVARVEPSPMVPPAQHIFSGLLRRNVAGMLSIQLRNGRLVTVDARTVIARGYYSRDLRTGKACHVLANSMPGGVLTALSVTKLHRALLNMPPDR
jgi:hypothetical protein